MSSDKKPGIHEQVTSGAISASDPRFARLQDETLNTSLLGIITAGPIFSPTGEVVDFEYPTANRVMQQTHGIAPEDLVGKRMLSVFPELRDHFTFTYYCDVAATGQPVIFESDFRTDELDIQVIVSVSRPDPDYITITFVEVSEIVRVTDALAELNALSGTQTDLSSYVTGVLDIGRRAFYATQAFQLELHDAGYNVYAQVGDEGVASCLRPLPKEIVLTMREAGTVSALRDIRDHLTMDAEEETAMAFPAFIGASYRLDETTVGALVFCFSSVRRREPTPSELKLVRTLSEAVGARIRLDAATTALRQRNEDLERFASLVSHDLKAPLRTIRLLSEMLAPYLAEDPQADILLGEIRGNADQAQSMIKSLRDFARLGSDGLRLESVDLKGVVDDTLTRLAADIRGAKAQIEVDVSGRVRADRTLLIQVFSNLILNALKYSGRPEPSIRIETAEPTDRSHMICVTDNGDGVDVRFAERIFELFRRVPGSEKKSDGEGVGLAVCRKIVESLGGGVRLDTEYTSGARFCVTLPKAD